MRILVPFLFDTKAAKDKPEGYIEGYASTWQEDQGGDTVHPKAFDKTMADHAAAGTMPHMFFNHNQSEPVGDWHSMVPDGNGLKCMGQMWVGKGIAKADQAHLMMKGNGPKGLSIGIIPRETTRDEKTGKRTIQSADLMETSCVAYPMNKGALATVKGVLEAETISVREAEEFLRDAGYSAVEAKAFLAKLKLGIIAERDAAIAEAKQLDALCKALQTNITILKGS